MCTMQCNAAAVRPFAAWEIEESGLRSHLWVARLASLDLLKSEKEGLYIDSESFILQRASGDFRQFWYGKQSIPGDPKISVGSLLEVLGSTTVAYACKTT